MRIYEFFEFRPKKAAADPPTADPLLFIPSYTAIEVAEHLVYFFKAREGIGVAFDDLHHLADLALVYDTDEHIFFGIRVHTVHLDLCDAVMQTRHQLFGKLLGVTCHDLKLVAVFEAAQSVIDKDIGDKQVEQRTDHRGDTHAVYEKRDQNDACIHHKGNICNVHLGARPFQECRYPVCAAACAKAPQHERKAKARDHARGDARKYDIEVRAVICKAVGLCPKHIVKARYIRLHKHIKAQKRAELFVDEDADQNKDRQIIGDHQKGPADIFRQ